MVCNADFRLTIVVDTTFRIKILLLDTWHHLNTDWNPTFHIHKKTKEWEVFECSEICGGKKIYFTAQTKRDHPPLAKIAKILTD